MPSALLSQPGLLQEDVSYQSDALLGAGHGEPQRTTTQLPTTTRTSTFLPTPLLAQQM